MKVSKEWTTIKNSFKKSKRRTFVRNTGIGSSCL